MNKKLHLSNLLTAAAEHSRVQNAAALTAPPAKKAKLVPVERVQFLVRLTPEARARIKHAAWLSKLSEQEFIERYALTLAKVE